MSQQKSSSRNAIHSIKQSNAVSQEARQLYSKALDGEILKLLLHFIYCGELETSDFNQIMSLLHAARDFKMTKIKDVCVKYLDENYNSANVLKVLLLADQCNEEVLLSNCIQFVKLHFNQLKADPLWQTIGPDVSLKIFNALRNETIAIIDPNDNSYDHVKF